MAITHLLARCGLLAWGLGVALGAQAGHIQSIDCNIDAYNLTGTTANDFDIKLAGVTASDVSQVFLRPARYFPNVSVSTESYGTLIHYSGRDVAHGESVHIGYEIFPAGPWGTIDQYWSLDGNRLGGPEFLCNPRQDFRDGNVVNTSSSDVWIRRRVAYQEDAVDLNDDLVRDSAFFASAMLVDTDPIPLLQNQTASYRFSDFGHGSYTTIFDVCADARCNSVTQTVFNSVFYTPEPGAWSLLVLGGLLLAAMRAAGRRRISTVAAAQHDGVDLRLRPA